MPGVIGSVLRLVDPVSVYCAWGEVESLICNFYLGVAVTKNCLRRSVHEVHSHVAGTLSKQQTSQQNICCLDVKQASNQQTIVHVVWQDVDVGYQPSCAVTATPIRNITSTTLEIPEKILSDYRVD